eukprot:COSAG06_NODE_7933_length_2329_cov_2.566310_2_plen_92_part_00
MYVMGSHRCGMNERSNLQILHVNNVTRLLSLFFYKASLVRPGQSVSHMCRNSSLSFMPLGQKGHSATGISALKSVRLVCLVVQLHPPVNAL